jgi:hypothetical protein
MRLRLVQLDQEAVDIVQESERVIMMTDDATIRIRVRFLLT